MFPDEELRPDIHRLRSDTIERRVGLAERQKQQINQRISYSDCVVRRQLGRFVEGGMDKIVGDPAGTGARREFACRYSRRTETALQQQFLRHDDDLVSRQRWADDRVRTRHIVGETIAGRQLDAAAGLLEMRNPVSLKQYFDKRMGVERCARGGMRKPMLACLDLTEL